MIFLGGSVTELPAFDRLAVEPSVARVRSYQGTDVGSGTGFLISGKRHYVTNHHVVDGGDRISVIVVRGGAAVEIPGRVVRSYPDRDLAVIETEEDGTGTALTLAVENPTKGLADLPKVFALGFPGGSHHVASNLGKAMPVATSGTVSKYVIDGQLKQGGRETRLVEHSAAINPGNSGGPLFDDCSRVVGVNTAVPLVGVSIGGIVQASRMHGVYLSVHASEVHEVLNELNIPVATVSDVCIPVNLAEKYGRMYLMVGSAALLGSTALLLLFRQRPALVAVPYQMARTTFSRMLGKPGPAARGSASRPDSRRGAPIPTELLDTGAVPAGVPFAGGRGGAPVPTELLEPTTPSGVSPSPSRAAYALVAVGAPGGVDRIEIPDGGATIGRTGKAALRVPDSSVSSEHARLSLDAQGRLVIEDLCSSNGTFVDGARITRTTVQPGQTVRLGKVSFRLVHAGAAVGHAVHGGGPVWLLKVPAESKQLPGFEVALPFGSAEKELRIGANPSLVDVPVTHKTVSSLHARVVLAEDGNGLRITDLSSSNGTFVDGRKISKDSVFIREGSRLRLGAVDFVLSRHS